MLACVMLALPLGCKKHTEENPDVDNSNNVTEPVQTVVTMVFRRQLDSKEFSIKVVLYEDDAPETCENFKNLIRAGHYNGTIIHRLVKDFVIQGGGYKLTPSEESPKAMKIVELDDVEPIKNEYKNAGWDKNTIKHDQGVIAMARTSNPDVATDQFYFNLKDNYALDDAYATFGRCADDVSLSNLIELGEGTTKQIQSGIFDDFPIPIIELITVTIDE